MERTSVITESLIAHYTSPSILTDTLAIGTVSVYTVYTTLYCNVIHSMHNLHYIVHSIHSTALPYVVHTV